MQMSTIKISRALLPTALGVLLMLGGCYSSPSPRPADSSYGAVSDDDIMKITYDATEILLQRSQQALTKSTPILVATFVNIDQFYFGRTDPFKIKQGEANRRG